MTDTPTKDRPLAVSLPDDVAGMLTLDDPDDPQVKRTRLLLGGMALAATVGTLWWRVTRNVPGMGGWSEEDPPAV